MNRHLTPLRSVVVFCVAVAATPAAAQHRPQSGAVIQRATAQVSAPARAELRGAVTDDRGVPLAGVVVSALGSASVFAVSDSEGQFTFRDISYGPYLIRAHLQDHLAAPAVLVQVNRVSESMATVVLTRRAVADGPAPVLAAGVGPADGALEVADVGETRDHDHGEVAWRLRHLKRSVLKDVDAGLITASDDGGSLLGDTLNGLGRAAGSPARLAASLFSGVPVTGQVDFLTSTSFDRLQDLLSMEPRGVAFVSLEAPTGEGRWAMRAAVMQGDLSSWVIAGSYRRAPTEHTYEAGVSYGTQRYQGVGIERLPLVADAGRSVGAIRVYDNWTISPRLAVRYGAKYAHYDYLASPSLLSPSASVTLTPFDGDNLRVRAAVSRRTVAPGAAEFVPPPSGPWLPPERTFSSIAGRGFATERADHLEIAAERQWGQIVAEVRAFRQNVDDQSVTIFEAGLPRVSAVRPGHYFVASAGDFDARGWGVGVRRATEAGTRASVEYTNVEARWVRRGPGAELLGLVTGSVPDDTERVHDLTASLEGVLPITETRVFVVYKINSSFADAGAQAGAGVRFDLQVNQALPFLNFSGARWEMLVAVRSLFSDDLAEASAYDELLVVQSPKRMVGGVAVKF
ncbi:MAG: TonB-dependent receptor [Acidobacteria bacterium]|nr:TonB-dependent receptor [Acidobacteriota bacterium]